MTEQAWVARSLRNWLWFSHHSSPIKVGVHCANLGSVCYEINGQTTTLLLNGKKVSGGKAPFSAADKAQSELLEGERLHWKWSVSEGIIELQNYPSGRHLSLLTGHCLITDHARHERIDCLTLPRNRLPSTALEITKPEGQPRQLFTEVSVSAHWTDSIPDESIRRLLKHLERHGAVNEDEVTQFLGSPRLARGFSSKLEDFRALIPFQVDIDTRSGLKTFRKA